MVKEKHQNQSQMGGLTRGQVLCRLIAGHGIEVAPCETSRRIDEESVKELHGVVRSIAVGHIAGDSAECCGEKGVANGRSGIDCSVGSSFTPSNSGIAILPI